MNRREALRAGAAFSGLSVAGCLGLFETESVWRDAPLVEDRPDAVYLPAGIEEMATYGTAQAGQVSVALQYTFPHRFWTVTGTSTSRVEVQETDALHLMLTVWDEDSGVVLPTESRLELRHEGSVVDSRALWSMLSQRMGFHYGDNVALDEGGSYVASVTLSPVDARLVGDLSGSFQETRRVDIEFEYDTDDVYDLEYSEIAEERRGSRSAVPLMRGDEGSGPVSTVPAPDALPGEVLGTATSGDAVFAASVIESGSRFAADSQYLLVSPRTPYNAIPFAQMELSATVTRENGDTSYEGRVPAAVDHEVGIHYGVDVEGLSSGDRIELSIDAPPQVSRHDGYETAFFEMPPVEFVVGE
jgi:hypothetical protein